MRALSCLGFALALVAVTLKGNSQALKCHVCMDEENCEEKECSQEEWREHEPWTKFVCSSADFGLRKAKSCEVEGQLQEIVGNDRYEYGSMTVDQYVSQTLKDLQAFLKYNVTVCSCSAELCNSEEEDKKRMEEQDRRNKTGQNEILVGSHSPNATRNETILRQPGNNVRNLLLAMEGLLFRILGWPY